jgi:sulfite oxidase
MGNDSKGNLSSASQPGGSKRILDMAAVSQKVGFTPATTPTSTPCPSTTPAEPIAVQCYAYSGGGRAISRVDVSLDGGKTWDQAELVNDCASPDSPCFGNKTWAWQRWRYVGKLPILSLPTTPDTTTTQSEP